MNRFSLAFLLFACTAYADNPPDWFRRDQSAQQAKTEAQKTKPKVERPRERPKQDRPLLAPGDLTYQLIADDWEAFGYRPKDNPPDWWRH